jgi:hypothetical protein
MRASEAQARLREAGIDIGMGMGDMLRAVFHLDLDDRMLEQSIHIFTKLFG